MFSEANPGQAFTQSLGFQVMAGGALVASADNESELEGAYRAVYALWHRREETGSGSAWRCNVL